MATITLTGGTVTDKLFGGDGDDVLNGGVSGADSLFGGNGVDTLYGRTGNDKIYGGDGNDGTPEDKIGLSGGGGDDTIYGGNGDDLLRGDLGIDTTERRCWRRRNLWRRPEAVDTYQFGPGSEIDLVKVYEDGENIDLLALEFEDLDLTKSGDDLRISIIDTPTDVMILEDFYAEWARPGDDRRDGVRRLSIAALHRPQPMEGRLKASCGGRTVAVAPAYR